MSTNPNVIILDKAWALLWNPASAYYLPKIMADGGNFGGTTIPPLGSVQVPNIDPIPIYSSDTWGNVSITLSSMTLDGLPSIQGQDFEPSSDATKVAATVAFGLLKFAGAYQVEGTGLVGCAMDIAEHQAYNPPVGSPADTDDGPGAGTPVPPQNLDLARSYRDQLVQLPNGTTLVSTFYDRNDTINRLLNQDNAFTEAWPYNAPSNPDDYTTAYYMQVTANATANPDNPNYTVGGDNDGYLTHSAYMKTLLVGTCLYYEEHQPEYAEDYHKLACQASGFQGYTNQYPNSMTAGSVLSAVANTVPMTEEELAAIPEPEAVRIGREAAERDFPELQARAMARRAARLEQATTYRSSGQFQFSFPFPTLTFKGTVAVSGIPPNQVLTLTLNSLQATIQNIKIDLFTGSDPTFTADAQDKLNDAQWFQQVLGTKVNARLGSEEVRSYLSNIFNQAILGVLNGVI